jgi:hypothetical protein
MSEALRRATPSPGRVTSSAAARVALSASLYLSLLPHLHLTPPDLDNSRPTAKLSRQFRQLGLVELDRRRSAMMLRICSQRAWMEFLSPRR